MFDERNHDEDKEEDEIEGKFENNLNSIFKKAKEDIEIAMESKEDQKQKILDILSEIHIPYINKACSNYFFDILEMLRKKKYLDTFVNLVRIKNNNKLLLSLKEAYLKELNILSGIREENSSLYMLKFIIGNCVYQLTKKDENKLERFLLKKNKVNPKYTDEIISMVTKTKNVFTMYICGLCLNIKEFDNKKQLENLFVSFLVDKIIDEENKDNNLAKLRVLSIFLNNISTEPFFCQILSNCGRLLSRSSKNYQFLSTVFISSHKRNYKDEFIKDVLFNEYKSFFFPTSYTNSERNNQINKSFKNIAENCNLNLLLKIILDINLEQNELYTYSYNFICRIFKIYGTNKDINTKYPLNEDLIIKSLLYILENFEKIYSDIPEQKDFINYFFQNFLSSLYCIPKINIDTNQQKENISKIGSTIKDLINNNTYSNYHNYFYLFPAALMEKFDFKFENEISDLFYSLLEDNYSTEITGKNSANILPLTTCSLNLSIQDKDFKAKSQDKLNKVFENMVTSNLFINNYNQLSQIESICLYLICKFLSKGKSSFTQDEENHTNFLKLLSKSLFKGKTSNNELYVFNQLVISLIEHKGVAFQILDLIFNFILHLDYSNKNHLISFRRVSIFLDKLTEKYFISKFIDDLDNNTFLKLIILIHIPNMHLDININNHKSHHKNMFIDKYYRDENKKNLLISCIEKNIIDTICPFIFSRYGLFNKSNIVIINSCYALIRKIFQETKASNLLLENSFGLLKYEKFKEVNDKLIHHKKNIDYLGKYELIDLVNKIKKEESDIIKSYDIQHYKEEEEKEEKKDRNLDGEQKEEEEKEVESKKNYKKGKNKNKNKPNENKKEKKENPKKKEEIKINEDEYKSYVFVHCYRLCNHMIFILKRLKPLFDHLNNFQYNNSKQNIKYVILKLWPLLKIDFCSTYIKRCFLDYFRDNDLSKRFSIEFSEIMFLEAINEEKEFNDNYKENQLLISKLNRKLIEIFKEKDTQKGKEYMINLFNYYDFVIIRLLFYIILNESVLIDDKIESVDNLINILQNLNSLNYEDISILLIPLLKSNYYGENMKVLLELYFKNAIEKSFIDLCKELLNYEYISKYSFMNSMIKENMNCIKNYQFIHYKIFVLSYEENEILNNLAKQIWEKFNLRIDEKFIDSDDFKLATKEHKATDMVNRAIREYVHQFPEKFKNVLQYLLDFYEEEIGKINEEREKIEEKEEDNDEEDESDEEIKYKNIHDPKIRKYLFYYINETLDLMNSSQKKELLDFFMKISDEEYSQDMFNEMNKSIFNLINSIPENEIITQTLNSIKNQILEVSEKKVEEINYNNLKIIMMMLNSVLVRIFHDKTFTKERETLFDVLLELGHHIDNKDIFNLLSKNIEYLSADIEEKSSKIFDELIEKLSNTKNKLYNFGDIYALSGLIKCFGISSYKEKKIDEIIKKNMEKKSSVEEKQNSMYTIKIFFETMKKLYEPYFVEIFEEISTMISNREKKVRETAQECFKGMMKELSGYGVDKIMPNLIKDLHTMNSKGKIANIEILGQFAYCAPKQLSIYIPKIIKEIMKVLTDPQKNVQETASNVLNDISSTIKNPEIADNADILIKAIQNPFDSSRNALEMMMETQFYHYLDPPSLALIIPILDYNLKAQNEELKRMSAHILGSMQVLIQDQNDLIQYMDIIVPDLKIALFDSDPNCRNEISKAVGALTKSLGPKYLTEMMKWLEGFLENESDTVHRSGAAQGYAEILVSFEESYMDKHLMRIINRIQEGNHIVKEGYLSVFVFLPGCLGDKFEKYFELIFPLIIEAFSDDHENVRNVSNKIFEICIKIFARKNTSELVEPLLERLFSDNWRIRNSSIALIKTLISSLGKEFSKENSEYFKKELRDQILTSTFILKSDSSGNTETLANIIWRDYVDNIPKYLSKILVNIYNQLTNLLYDEMNEETYNIARANVGLLATKFSDKFFNELIPLIRETITKEKDKEYITDASFTMIYIAVTEISERLLAYNRNMILKLMYENIFTEFSSVREKIAKIVYLMSIRLNDHNMNRNLVNNVMKQVRGKPNFVQKQTLEIVGNLTEISKGEVIRYVIAEIFRKPYEEGFLDLGNMISSEIVESIDDQNEAKSLFDSLYETFINIPSASMNTIVAITSKLDEEYLELFIKFLEKILKKIKSDIKNSKDKKRGKESIEFYFSELISSFCSKAEQSLESVYDNLVEIIISLLHYDNDSLIKNVGSFLKTLVEKTEKSPDVDLIVETLISSMDNLYEEIKAELDNDEEKFSEVIGKKIILIMEHLLFTVQNELLYGNNKVLACRIINDIIHYCPRKNLKPYIMKLVGPMIRILGEKIPPETKEKLMENAKNLIMKVQEDIKGISTQLQSVFIKTLNDSNNIYKPDHHQIKAGENIILLLKYFPRLDVTANDLFKSIQNKLDQKSGIVALLEMEILSDVIRFYGQNLKSDTITKQFNTVKMWQETHNEISYDIMFILLTSYSPFLSKEVIDDLEFLNSTSKDLYKILSIFNGNLDDFKERLKFFIEEVKTLKLDIIIYYLIPIGKIINKYNYYKSINPEKNEKIKKAYTSAIVEIFSKEIKLKPTNDKMDAELCLFIMNLGFIEEYETNKKFCKNVFNFLLKLMALSKVNFQILISCFSLIVLKKVVTSPNKDDILDEVKRITEDEKDLEIIETFLKKIYYIHDK